ncbi:unnamed protein product [Linum tenue]|uniref:Uncharacterized protein n=1 Tax=Linum tenue TaxID=586396 RepID=A0AAV0ISM3_9ROSI|nr:unnamed protein product [Linum tenue]
MASVQMCLVNQQLEFQQICAFSLEILLFLMLSTQPILTYQHVMPITSTWLNEPYWPCIMKQYQRSILMFCCSFLVSPDVILAATPLKLIPDSQILWRVIIRQSF